MARPTNCERLRFVVESRGSGYLAVAAYDGNQRVGLLTARKDNGHATIDKATAIHRVERCGVRPQLQQLLGLEACRRGLKLRSSRARTAKAESYWAKLKKRNRAKCVWRNRRHKIIGGVQVTDRGTPVTNKDGSARKWTCAYYESTEPCRPAPVAQQGVLSPEAESLLKML